MTSAYLCQGCADAICFSQPCCNFLFTPGIFCCHQTKVLPNTCTLMTSLMDACLFWQPATKFAKIFSTMREAAWYIISVVSVCLYVCLYVCQTITFESLDVGSSYLHMRHVSTDYGLSSYMNVIGSRSRSQEPKRPKMSKIPMIRNVKLRSAITPVLSNIEP